MVKTDELLPSVFEVDLESLGRPFSDSHVARARVALRRLYRRVRALPAVPPERSEFVVGSAHILHAN